MTARFRNGRLGSKARWRRERFLPGAARIGPLLFLAVAAQGASNETAPADSGWSVATLAGPVAPPPGFVWIPAGTFPMGSPADEPGRFDDEARHQVTLTKPFYLCDHEVTQGEWQATMGWNDSRFAGDPERPVENVTWFDCVVYCNQRSRDERLTPVYAISDRQAQGRHLVSAWVTWDSNANGYRLPTEAEWEYACRAGSNTALYNGPITFAAAANGCVADSLLYLISWYCANAEGSTHAVRGKPPNAWGLYDMAGNVQQWCWDWFWDLSGAAAMDPTGPESGFLRLWRGGGWDYNPRHCRSADRGRDEPGDRYDDVGFRVARWPGPLSPAGRLTGR